MIDIKLFCQALKMTWKRKYIDPLNFSPWKILLIDSLEKWGGDKILPPGKEGLNTVASTLNPFWKDILDNFSNLENEKVIDGNDVLNQSIWLNSHIKVNNTSPCLKNWIEKDIYIINDLLDQNKQIMSYEIFRDTYHVDTTFVEFYGIISAIPRHWKHLINTCHNLIYKENKFLHQLQIDPKPCKYFYRQFIDKNTVVPVNIIDKWSNEFDIEETEWGLIFSVFFIIKK
jgi:hypothetical protein